MTEKRMDKLDDLMDQLLFGLIEGRQAERVELGRRLENTR